MTRLHVFRTGSVWIKAAQVRAAGSGLTRTINGLFGAGWSAELPIYAYLIERDDGLILVDTGETADVMTLGYFDRWHPYYRFSVRFAVKPEDEIGPQLCGAGFDPTAVGTVVQTHMHTDHAGGLRHFPQARVIVSETEWKTASGFAGRAGGYPNHRWPNWLKPDLWSLQKPTGDLLEASRPLTADSAVRVVATPGHTLGHVSVSVEDGDRLFLIAGDVSYLQETLLQTIPDGLGADPEAEVATHRAILDLARQRPLVYLNGHDPDCAGRLERREALPV